MTLEEAKALARKEAIKFRHSFYVYQTRSGDYIVTLDAPRKHIGTFTYPDEMWEKAK